MRRPSGNTVNIIGAGPGGLAAAMLLARAGAQVRVFERLPQVGGRTSTLEVDGFRFDRGPTFFLYPRILGEIFAAVGRDLATEVPMVKLDPQYRLTFGAGGTLDATPDVDRMERQITALSPGDAGGFSRFLADNRQKLARFDKILQTPFERVSDFFRADILQAAPWLRPWKSLASDLGRHFRDPRLRLAFSFQAKYLGMSPFRCPSLFSILSYMEYEYGVFHPIGGCGAVSERMAEICREMGVQVHLGEPVTSLEFEGRRVVGVETDRGHFRADATIINADFARAMERLVPDHLRRRWTDKKLATKQYSCSTFMLYLGLDGLDRDLPHHSIYITKDYEGNLRDIETRRVLTDDPSFYVQNACVTDPGLAPPGMSTLYVLVPVPNQESGIDWRRETPRFRRLALDQLRKLGIEDIERRIRVERIVTPDDWDRGFEIYRGATFNLAHSLSQMLHLRPHNRFEDLDGVYLVGGGTHPGSGLPVIYESARITSRLIAEDLRLDLAHVAPPRPMLLDMAADAEAELAASPELRG